ncbi:hypothetical protein [Novosphingobium terrae]|uniref:hypothetical protein n=1 Tax=Novosphingobium terrae TaxID=2726189 RepID=UPI00197F527E|nr:hypothetical protein [Novosphingobium terrae]
MLDASDVKLAPVLTPSEDRIWDPIVALLAEVLVVDVVAVEAVDDVEELVDDVVVMTVRTAPVAGA